MSSPYVKETKDIASQPTKGRPIGSIFLITTERWNKTTHRFLRTQRDLNHRQLHSWTLNRRAFNLHSFDPVIPTTNWSWLRRSSVYSPTLCKGFEFILLFILSDKLQNHLMVCSILPGLILYLPFPPHTFRWFLNVKDGSWHSRKNCA